MRCYASQAASVCRHSIHPQHLDTHWLVDQHLISSIDLSFERKRYVILVMDEVHMKEDLVQHRYIDCSLILRVTHCSLLVS